MKANMSWVCITAMVLAMAGPANARVTRKEEPVAAGSFVSTSGHAITAYEQGNQLEVVVSVNGRDMTFVVQRPTATSRSISVFVGDAVFTETPGSAGAPTTWSIGSESRGGHTQIDLMSQANELAFYSYQDEGAIAAFLANADTGVPDILQAVFLDTQPDAAFWTGVEELASEMGAGVVDTAGSGCFSPCMACMGAILMYIASLMGLGAGCGPSPFVGITCVAAFLGHAGASASMIAACTTCAECMMDLNDGGREDDDDNTGSNRAFPQG